MRPPRMARWTICHNLYYRPFLGVSLVSWLSLYRKYCFLTCNFAKYNLINICVPFWQLSQNILSLHSSGYTDDRSNTGGQDVRCVARKSADSPLCFAWPTKVPVGFLSKCWGNQRHTTSNHSAVLTRHSEILRSPFERFITSSVPQVTKQ